MGFRHHHQKGLRWGFHHHHQKWLICGFCYYHNSRFDCLKSCSLQYSCTACLDYHYMWILWCHNSQQIPTARNTTELWAHQSYQIDIKPHLSCWAGNIQARASWDLMLTKVAQNSGQLWSTSNLMMFWLVGVHGHEDDTDHYQKAPEGAYIGFHRYYKKRLI